VMRLNFSQEKANKAYIMQYWQVAKKVARKIRCGRSEKVVR
jgi:hypothetical protein